MSPRFLAILAALPFLLAGLPTAADQRDPRLADLMAGLTATSDPAEAGRLDREIWSIWMVSGDPETDRMLEQGTMALSQQAWPVALSAFNLVIERRPDFAEGWNKRATLYYLMDRYDESARDVERTLALEPRHYGALSGMGLIELQRGRLPQAMEWFGKALAVNPHLDGIRSVHEQLELQLKGKPI